jgi:hypothetical protein
VVRRPRHVRRKRNWLWTILIAVALVALAVYGIRYDVLSAPHGSTTTASLTSQTTVPSTTQTTATQTSQTTATHASRTASSHTSQTTVQPGSQTAVYLTNSAPTSQWLILSSSQLPTSVTANNTGLLPRFYSSESLNATKIGVYCVQTVTDGAGNNSTAGGCAQFETYQQTGWYWDQQDQLLFIHYLGGPNVQIRVVVPEDAPS